MIRVLTFSKQFFHVIVAPFLNGGGQGDIIVIPAISIVCVDEEALCMRCHGDLGGGGWLQRLVS